MLKWRGRPPGLHTRLEFDECLWNGIESGKRIRLCPVHRFWSNSAGQGRCLWGLMATRALFCGRSRGPRVRAGHRPWALGQLRAPLDRGFPQETPRRASAKEPL